MLMDVISLPIPSAAVVHDAGNEVKSISAAQDQSRKSHVLFGFVSCPSQYQTAAGDCK